MAARAAVRQGEKLEVSIRLSNFKTFQNIISTEFYAKTLFSSNLTRLKGLKLMIGL